MVAVCPDWNVDMYEPGVDRMGFVGGTGGGPVGVVEVIAKVSLHLFAFVCYSLTN